MQASCLKLDQVKTTSTTSDIRSITLFLSKRKMKMSRTSNPPGCPSAGVVGIMAACKLPPAQKHPSEVWPTSTSLIRVRWFRWMIITTARTILHQSMMMMMVTPRSRFNSLSNQIWGPLLRICHRRRGVLVWTNWVPRSTSLITLCCPRASTPCNSLLCTPTRALWHYSSGLQTGWSSTIPQEVWWCSSMT